MKHWQIALSIFAALSASLALAEDFKTIKGKQYKDATITRLEGTELCLEPKREFRRFILLNSLKTFRKSFAPVQRRPAQHSVSRLR